MDDATVGRVPWWSDHAKLARLYRFLDYLGLRPDDVAYFLERPWKWDKEYRWLIEAERRADERSVDIEEVADEVVPA